MKAIFNLIPLPYKIGLAFAFLAFLVLWHWAEVVKYREKVEAACELKFSEASTEADKQSKKGADDVRKKVQSLDDAGLDAELCRLGIVQQNRGCQSKSGVARTGNDQSGR